jgi:hypothetical protein
MRKKLSIGVAFLALLAAGAGAAALTAGAGPASMQATTTITSTITTGTITTVTTITTTTPDTTTTTTTTATPPAPRKITICHHAFRAKSTKHVTIRIDRSAWKAHQRHGDSIGACNTATAKKFHSRKAHIAKFHHGRRK